MPPNAFSKIGNVVDSDDEDKPRFRNDEYGEKFEDYGFLKRAEEYKASGNEDFKKERYESAMTKYNDALDQLITVAHDKSIVIGERKFEDVIVLRSLIRLNISTCHFKLKEWEKAAKQALECLMGNMREESMMGDPHVKKKIKDAERKGGSGGLAGLTIEARLPRATRAKGWFRLSQCYANLENVEQAKESLSKALEVCDDDNLLAEFNQHALRLEVMESQQKDRQKKQFAGFFDRLQERGGYNETERSEETQNEGRPSVVVVQSEGKQAANAEQRARFEELDNDD